MNRSVEKLPHECGARDGMQIFEEGGKYTGYCYACSTYVSNPFKDQPTDYRKSYFSMHRIGKKIE